MSATLMRGVLDQIQTQAQQVSGPSNRQQSARGDDAPSFSDVLFNSINEINKTQVEAKSKTQQWMSGSSDVALNDVMLAMQKSSISFSFGMQARNKMIGAYQEIMNTPV
ncbi:flagellar hook-basal body protein FliE [Enterobacter hormaechei subsp. hoffmannii]|uniref:flagellar hook-basal body complex protein FliE n=1 Tax=Enterobacter hormaechei TaxID=158836 RepID=UPI0006281EFE|nr:flagellar hook-basal body complex protein FliE [Enterobacter hormaechei]KKJ31775.1 flagellar hook-basal body protein FliE [Enterobacter hormaechei subsp. hoffmannii]